MASRADVFCGQINLHKGLAGTTNLMLYLDTIMQTGNQRSQVTLGQRPRTQDRLNNKITAFLVSLQEPPTHGSKVVGLGKGNHVFYDSSSERPRSAIYASRNLQLWLAPQFTSRDVVTCLWIWPNGKEVMVTSVYMDILNRQVIDNTLLKLLQHCRDKDIDLLICADTNAHSSLWNCDDTNERGGILEDYIFHFNLQIHNEGNHFTFFRGAAKTIIDVTLTKGLDLGHRLHDWEVSDAVQGSDHLLLQWRLTISSPKHINIRDMKVGDWLLFQDTLEGLLADQSQSRAPEGAWTPRLLDERTLKFKSNVLRALDESHPTHWIKPKVRIHPEFTPELLRWKKKVHACFSQYRLRGTVDRVMLFRRANG